MSYVSLYGPPQKMSIFSDILDERFRQDVKFGSGNVVNRSPVLGFTVLGEEVGEVAHAVLEEDWPNYRDELVQVAAVAVAMIEAFDREKENANIPLRDSPPAI